MKYDLQKLSTDQLSKDVNEAPTLQVRDKGEAVFTGRNSSCRIGLRLRKGVWNVFNELVACGVCL